MEGSPTPAPESDDDMPELEQIFHPPGPFPNTYAYGGWPTLSSPRLAEILYQDGCGRHKLVNAELTPESTDHLMREALKAKRTIGMSAAQRLIEPGTAYMLDAHHRRCLLPPPPPAGAASTDGRGLSTGAHVRTTPRRGTATDGV